MSSEFATPQELPLITKANFEIVLDQIVAILTAEEVKQRALAVAIGRAQGTLILPVQVTDTDTMTVDAKVYTFLNTLTGADGEIKIGSTLAETQANIVAAFDLSGTAGVQYGNLMVAHPTVDIAAFVFNEAVLTAKTSGAAGNNIVTTETFTDVSNVFDGVTLGTTITGLEIDEDEWGFNVRKEIHDPFQAFTDFKRPLVNIIYESTDNATQRAVTSKKFPCVFAIDVYAQAPATEVDQGTTLSSIDVNRVIRQIFYILESPKYKNLRLDYQDLNGNLVKFIEKLSVSNVKKIFPKEPLPKENVAIAQITFNVDLIENLFDLQGNPLTLINALVTEPITQPT